jgi:hypothetical protein
VRGEIHERATTRGRELDDTNVRELVFDPWRFGQAAQELEREGITVTQFPQTDARMVPASDRLYRAIVEKRLILPYNEELRQHAAAAIAKHSRRGWRIDKANRADNIDAIVALCIAPRPSPNQWNCSDGYSHALPPLPSTQPRPQLLPTMPTPARSRLQLHDQARESSRHHRGKPTLRGLRRDHRPHRRPPHPRHRRRRRRPAPRALPLMQLTTRIEDSHRLKNHLSANKNWPYELCLP